MTTTRESFTVSAAALAGVHLLRGLDRDGRDAVARRCAGRRYPAGATVVSADDAGGEVYLILSGTLRASFFSSNGKEVTFRDQDAGQMFGEISAIDGHPRSANVVALTDASLAVLPRADFLELVCGKPALAHNTLVHLAGLVRSLSDRVVEFSTLGVRNRIHSELLRLAVRAGGGGGGRVALDPAPRHTDIANRVSTHREAVSRELGELVRTGLVERDGQAMVITDLERLRQLVSDVVSPSSR